MGSLPPVVQPADRLDDDQAERSARTIALPGFGAIGQARLAAARVLVLGAGGLGSPVLQYLAAAGVGVIGVVDDDVVDRSNLQRQVIHQTASVGEAKTASAARAIAALTPHVTVRQHAVRLDRGNALALFAEYDLIVDGTDNFSTRYLANDAAAILRLPYVWGSVLRYDGQVTVFWEGAPHDRSLDYRDLHPVPPAPGEVLSCAEAGVLATACATIGAMMATEAIKLITGLGEPLLGRVQTLDALSGSWAEFRLRRAPGRVPVAELIDYEEFCGVEPAAPTVTAGELASLRQSGAVRLVDVREPHEHEAGHLDGDELVPLGILLDDPRGALGDSPALVVAYCATGVRSARAASALRAVGLDAVSLAGGFAAVPAGAGR
ncbi:ThiF family adenylyltransferase [Galbitalea soli]|uniref:Adenylyltransferase/sulfurtransferase MoeZ n=1 Tax=Galbitalea soli TaxID=1268042 RepID=A0A7C9PMJ0_9MICO|nr:ThiF family adenylyltransferase [Galbitalea soli]NEM90769.1 adenylyltransferase/sulfurtransferase MoeZ [Galbitalea soli]NYJ31487.1 adenylyltransferase/sulfurtransferase [Galbitalea soli]